MVETQKVQNPTFTTIQFVTKDGEKCTATKNNGVVTIQGDKNGVRQMPVEQFMKELVATLPKNVDLARTPNKDTVQFSGSENPTAQAQQQQEETVEETNSKLNKKFMALGAAALTVIGAGIYFIGRGRWWSKAAKEVERKGQELAEDATNAVREGIHGGGKSGDAATKPADDVVAQAEELIGKKAVAQVSEEWKAAYETDPAKVLKMGQVDKDGIVTVKNEAGEVTARYVLSEGKNPKIFAMDDLSAVNPDGTIRRVFYQNGKPWSYANVAKDEPMPMAINRKKLREISEQFKEQQEAALKPTEKPVTQETKPVEQPKTPVQQQPKFEPNKTTNSDELLRQQEAERLRLLREQEAADNANNDIINAAIIADIASGAGKKGAQAAESVVNGGVAKIETPKIEIPRPQTVAEEGEQAARDVFAHNPKPYGETPVSTPESALDDIIKPNTDDIIRPNTDDIFAPTNEFELPKTDFEVPGSTFEEPLAHIEPEPHIDITDDFMDGGMF